MELKYANVTYFIQESQLKGRFCPTYQSCYWVKRMKRSIASSRSADLKDKERISGHRCINHPRIPKNGKTRWFIISFRLTQTSAFIVFWAGLSNYKCVCVFSFNASEQGDRHPIFAPRTPSRADGGRMKVKYANVAYFIQESQLRGRLHPTYQSSYWAKEGREALRHLGLPI
ncbi:hypothetical protein CEXT_228891 [Caerostris extrusa]|uniref:Uncharacterized protein n=1 Tax=Caerostris extrusa TaxID=172846 RepID=A0AAV4NPK8_CAEEX|nr:hypothetical protein CEXT_228891 [Caerostris extrusa]